MNITTQRYLIQNVAKRWHLNYWPFAESTKPLFSVRNGFAKPRSKKDIYDDLLAIDPDTATAEEVDAIIGNGSWTRLCCDECGKRVDRVVNIGSDEEFPVRAASICLDCIASAHRMVASSET